MDPLTAALVMGGVSAVGAHLSSQNAANQASQSADRQMQFQERMSNTSYTRQVQDLKDAGLNPNLAYPGGGASSPSGAAMTSDHPNPLEQLGSSAIQTVSLKKDLAKKQGEIDLAGQMAETQKTQQHLNEWSAKSAAATAQKTLQEEQILKANTPAIKAEAKLREKDAGLKEKTLYYDYGAEKINQLMGLANTAKQMKNIGTKIREIHVDPKTGEILK